MLLVREILGDWHEPRFAGRPREALLVDSSDAAKRRLRGVTDAGTDVAIDLGRGSYLAHGAVLADDGERIVVVERRPEEAVVVRLALDLPPAQLAEQAARLGHAFGNQHVPIELEGGELRIPITTSVEIARETVLALGLEGVTIEVATVRLGARRPLGAGPGPGHTHGHELRLR